MRLMPRSSARPGRGRPSRWRRRRCRSYSFEPNCQVPSPMADQAPLLPPAHYVACPMWTGRPGPAQRSLTHDPKVGAAGIQRRAGGSRSGASPAVTGLGVASSSVTMWLGLAATFTGWIDTADLERPPPAAGDRNKQFPKIQHGSPMDGDPSAGTASISISSPRGPRTPRGLARRSPGGHRTGGPLSPMATRRRLPPPRLGTHTGTHVAPRRHFLPEASPRPPTSSVRPEPHAGRRPRLDGQWLHNPGSPTEMRPAYRGLSFGRLQDRRQAPRRTRGSSIERTPQRRPLTAS